METEVKDVFMSEMWMIFVLIFFSCICYYYYYFGE